MTQRNDPFSQLLYPMLSEQPSVDAAVVAELARAPLQKSAESNALRRRLLDTSLEDIALCARAISSAVAAGGRVLACGNGGSATSAADMVAELLHPAGTRPPIGALCLTADIAVVTAIGNDVSFDDVFVRQLLALGRPGDVLLAISTSGNSENLVRAAREGRRLGMLTVGIAGHDGGRMRAEGALDHLFTVPSSSVHRIQEVQTTLYHLLFELVQRHLTEVPSCA
ncbi:SIS domain-containing protein [Candidatus Aeolococcus gillhamiae]|uniref:Phosphoheptose isomerase n=2 Tax=Candidatus Aeolococcus gillhamiae TaxID=3127015 RepID=A0A2W6A388_9BACT|nr:MAG: phosphoheptose isomerase [Candidatus Dormibacter sp. RRmetagenome_bin12]